MPLDRMPDDLAERTARLVMAVEDQLAAAQDDKKQVYADLREELKSQGMGGAEISKEVAAFKAAIAETRRTDEQRLAAGEKSDRADEFVMIIRGSRARARARAGRTTDASANLIGTIATAMQTDIGRKALTSAIDVMIEREEHEPRPSPRPGTAAASVPPEAAAETHPVANVEEEANGAIAVVSDDPASREVDDADRQQLAASGFTGEDDGRDVEASGGAAPVTHSPETAERGAGPETAPASDGGAVSALKAQGRMGNAVGVEPSPSINSTPAERGQHDHGGQRVGRTDGEQYHEAPVSGAERGGEGADGGDQGQGAGASGTDRHLRAVSRTELGQDQDGRGGDVGGEARHQVGSSDLHDGRLQAVPAPALDESRDSAAGVEAPAAPSKPVNPRCVKHRRGEPCQWSHGYAACSECLNAHLLARGGAA